MKRLTVLLLLFLLLAAGCTGKTGQADPTPAPATPAATAAPTPGPAPAVTPEPAAVPDPSETPVSAESDGSENLGYFVLQPSDGVLEVPMMGLRIPLSGELLDAQEHLTAEVWVERQEAILYLALMNEHPDTDIYAYPYDYIFLSIWGETQEDDDPDLRYLGKNDAFYYYYLNYADVVSQYPDYFSEQADCMTEEELARYDALMADAAGVMAEAEILPLTLPEVPKPEDLGEWFASAEVMNLNGICVSLGEFIAENKLTLLNIWGTFCGPCIREMPDLADLARDYGEQGFGIVGLTCDILDATGRIQQDVVQDALDILESTGVEYPVLILSPELERATDLMYVPTSYFVDASGRVLEGPITGSMSGEDWKKKIEEHLAALE